MNRASYPFSQFIHVNLTLQTSKLILYLVLVTNKNNIQIRLFHMP